MSNGIQIALGVKSTNPIVDGGMNFMLYDNGLKIDPDLTHEDKVIAVAILRDTADAIEHHINGGGAA